MIRLRVKEVAEEKGVSMTQLTHMTFLAFNTVRSLWRNPTKPVSTETLERVAKALGVSVHSLIEEVEDVPEDTSK
jgi:DNA-binding Xre family transcriptional regulator